MVLKINSPEGKPLYIKGSGNFYYLSKDSKNALSDIPEGFEIVKTKNGKLYIRKKN